MGNLKGGRDSGNIKWNLAWLVVVVGVQNTSRHQGVLCSCERHLLEVRGGWVVIWVLSCLREVGMHDLAPPGTAAGQWQVQSVMEEVVELKLELKWKEVESTQRYL